MSYLNRILLMAVLAAASLRAEEGAPEASPAAPAAAEIPVLSADDTEALEARTGSDVMVEGTIRSIGTSADGGTTFLGFGDRRSGLVAVVFREAYEKFPEGFEQFRQQQVRVRGSLEKYRDRQLQIKITTPDQLQVLAAEPSEP